MKNKKRQHRKPTNHRVKKKRTSETSHKVSRRKRVSPKKHRPGLSKRARPVRQTLKHFLSEVKVFSLVLVATVIVGVISASFFFSLIKVSGYGMMPSLRDKDVLLVKKRPTVKRFDFILLDNGISGEVRRIIGLPGEKIEYVDDTLLVDSVPVEEKALVDKINSYQIQGMAFTQDFTTESISQETMIPGGYYLVLGDNRPYTTDSREYGLISETKIKGKVIARLFPLEEAKRY